MTIVLMIIVIMIVILILEAQQAEMIKLMSELWEELGKRDKMGSAPMGSPQIVCFCLTGGPFGYSR